MLSFVTRKTATIIERLWAGFALERFFICVNDLVFCKSPIVCKCFSANITIWWIVMSVHVDIEVTLISEGLFTKITFGPMCLPVLFKIF